MNPAALFSKGFMPIAGPVVELLLLIAFWGVFALGVNYLFYWRFVRRCERQAKARMAQEAANQARRERGA